ncbi:MAG: S1 RNA-binding domain-containing protein [Fibrobacterota bacterium]
MVEFAAFIEDSWELPYEVSEEICSLYERGSSKYFVSNYVPTVSACVTTDILSEIYRFLDKQKELEPLRDRARSVLKKANLLDEENQEKIDYSISEAEIEDVYIAHRTGVRTKGRLAVERGLAPLAEKVHAGDTDSFEEEAQGYVDAENDLPDVSAVKNGVTAILAEKYGFDEEARIMLREFAEDEGMVSLHFKKKAKKKYDKFTDSVVLFADLEDRELLELRRDEENGELKVKVALPPIHVMELMKEHFWEEDSTSAENPLIIDALHDAWDRLLYPMVEKSIKEMLFERAENNLVSSIKTDLRPSIEEYAKSAKKTLLFVAAYSEEALEILVVDSSGSMLRSTQESVRQFGRPFVSKKIKQLYSLYHPSRAVILNNEYGDFVESVIEQTSKVTVSSPEIEKIPVTTKISNLMKSEYFKKDTEGLPESIIRSLAYAVSVMKPFAVISKVGAQCFSIHPQEKLIGYSALEDLIDDLYVAAALEYGVVLGGSNDSILASLGATAEDLDALRNAARIDKIGAKKDIQSIDTIDERVYTNISGYVVFPKSSEVLDKSTVHPEEFDLVRSICDELGLSPEGLIRNSGKIRDFHAEDSRVEEFVQKNIADQLRVAKRYLSLTDKSKRPYRINELQEGMELDGKVTNITGFGAFVDINSYSDGLVHISELANEYVESPDQVVSVGDAVKVKIVEIDKRKKRISLSMKQASDSSSRRLRPSRTQLEDLVSLFNK